MQIGYPYVALALIVGSRRMISAVPELFDRAAYGDPFEIMQSARTGLENAFVDNFESLGQYALAALGSSRAGTRYWAVHELGRLRNPAWLGELARMLDDRASGVREMARSALTMIAVARPESVLEVTNALQRYLTLASNVNEVRATERDLKQIEASRADRSASSSASKISGS